MAGVELATAWVRLVPSMDGVQGAIAKEMSGGNVGAAAGETAGKNFTAGSKKGLAGLAGVIGGAFVVTAAANFFADSMAAVQNWETLNAQTASAVKATGGAANVTAKQVNDLANSLEGATATEAESIQEGANLLLTFKNIRNEAGKGNDIFDQSTTALVDMARAMGTEPEAAAIQLGKALNDPIGGIASLSRVGVQFTDDQKNLIKTLVESGDTMGAQKVILGELQSQFGGSGAAYADTYQGKLMLLQDSFGELGESIVSSLVPALSDLFATLTPIFDWLGQNQGVLVAIAAVFGVLLVAAFFAWTASIWAANVALLANPITWIILAVVALIAIIVLLVANWDAVVAFLTDVWQGFVDWFMSVMDAFLGWWNGLWTSV